MDLTGILAWLQTPQGASIAALVGTLVASAFHAFGYAVPVFSAAVNKATGTTPVVAAGAPTQVYTPPVPPLVGGQQNPAALSPTSAVSTARRVGRSHPLFGALTQLLGQQNGLPATHPLIQEAASMALADAPTLLSLFPQTAALMPLLSLGGQLLHGLAPAPVPVPLA